jgi:hypothetical protein
MPMPTEIPPRNDPLAARRANVRTGVILASIAAVFFAGIIMARMFVGDSMIGISVLGGAVLLFLVIAIGRNLRQ